MKPIILATTSKYRLELFSRLRVPFTAEAPGVVETSFHQSLARPKIIAEGLALEKARAVLKRHPEALVIGADQVASLKGALLGKPGDAETALHQLNLLAGKTHELITAVALVDNERVLWHTEVTKLKMVPHTNEALRRYVELEKPFDCAGSYKIESLGISLFESVEGGDVTAIMGLPLMAVAKLLREAGYSVP